MAKRNASIDFGLVHIPVEIVTAEDRQEKVTFHMLDSKDNSRIRLKRVNENTGREVEWEDIVKGYEVSEGTYAVFTSDELDELEAEANQSLIIDTFVGKDEISPEYFESPYYVVPAKGGEKGYALLEKVLDDSSTYAVIQAVLYNKERVGVLYSKRGGLMMSVLRYADEIKDAKEILPPSSKLKVTPKEVAMAQRLLKEMSGKFKPEKYEDNYQSKLRTAIKKKTKSGVKTAKTTSKSKTQKNARRGVVNIADLLERSLGKGQTKRVNRKRAA